MSYAPFYDCSNLPTNFCAVPAVYDPRQKICFSPRDIGLRAAFAPTSLLGSMTGRKNDGYSSNQRQPKRNKR
jgi:hypothetical protein